MIYEDMRLIFILTIIIVSQCRNGLTEELPEFVYPSNTESATDLDYNSNIQMTSNDFATDFMPESEPVLDHISPNLNEPNRHSEECRFTEICDRNEVIYVNNTIKLGSDILVFFHYDHQTVPYLLSGIGLVRSPENPEFDFIKINSYENWNQMNGTTLTQLNDFVTAIPYQTVSNDFENLENDFHVIFIVKDPSLTYEYLLAYDVKYANDYQTILSFNKFVVDPYRYDRTHDQLEINHLYRNFPSDYQSKAKPIVLFALPYTNDEPPNRVFVFYEETNPNETSHRKSKVHILKQKMVDEEYGRYKWVYDENSGDCMLIYGHKIDAAVIISHINHQYINNEFIDKFYELEFYSNGEYGVRSVEIRGTSDRRGVTAASFDASNVKVKVPIRNLLNCHICYTYKPWTMKNESEAIKKSESRKKFKKVWLWVFGFIILLIIIAAIGVAIFCHRRRQIAAKEGNEDIEDKDESQREFDRRKNEVSTHQTLDERPLDEDRV